VALEFIVSHEENNRDDLRLVTGTNCGSGPCGSIFTIHVLGNRHKMTALHPTTNVMFSILYTFFIITILHPFGAVIVPLLLTIASSVSSNLCIRTSNFVYIV